VVVVLSSCSLRFAGAVLFTLGASSGGWDSFLFGEIEWLSSVVVREMARLELGEGLMDEDRGGSLKLVGSSNEDRFGVTTFFARIWAEDVCRTISRAPENYPVSNVTSEN